MTRLTPEMMQPTQRQKTLYDHNGLPMHQRPTYAQEKPKGMGGGYKKVDDNGYGRVTYKDYDPVTGIMSLIHFDGEGKMITKRYQNVDAIVDMNKVYKDDHRPHMKAKMQRQTSIPTLEFWKIMEQCGYKAGKAGGDYDKKRFDQIINDPDYAKFRTVPGKISCQYRTWY